MSKMQKGFFRDETFRDFYNRTYWNFCDGVVFVYDNSKKENLIKIISIEEAEHYIDLLGGLDD